MIDEKEHVIFSAPRPVGGEYMVVLGNPITNRLLIRKVCANDDEKRVLPIESHKGEDRRIDNLVFQ